MGLSQEDHEQVSSESGMPNTKIMLLMFDDLLPEVQGELLEFMGESEEEFDKLCPLAVISKEERESTLPQKQK
jgi:hypothetical protein